MDVERWIRQAKAGDPKAFNHLAHTFQDLLFHVALQHSSGNDDDALDACQDAMLAAWKAMPRFDGDARGFRAWLVRIVVNACRDRHRYDRRRPTQPIEFENAGETRTLPLPDPGQSPQEYAENQDLGALLEWALSQLSEDHRTVIVLDQAGFDYAQIADIVGVEVGTIKSRLSRARSHMRTALEGNRQSDAIAAEAPKPAEPRTAADHAADGQAGDGQAADDHAGDGHAAGYGRHQAPSIRSGPPANATDTSELRDEPRRSPHISDSSFDAQ